MLNIQVVNLIASFSYETTFKKLRCLNHYTYKHTKKQSILRYLHKLKMHAKQQSFLNKQHELKLYCILHYYLEPITNKNIIKYKPYQH